MRKGILLAGGLGTRLRPITAVLSKQLIPVYNKPTIYYPLSTLMMAGIRDFLIISTPEYEESFRHLLGDGSQWGISIDYEIQMEPKGIAQALIIAENYLDGSPCALMLGDNILFGGNLRRLLKEANNSDSTTLFVTPIDHPELYGILSDGKIVEKPSEPKSNLAIIGLYFYDENASEIAKSLEPSPRGELEITDLNNKYLEESATIKTLGRGIAWFDTGNFDDLLEASEYVRTIEKRQGLLVSAPEEVAWREGYITTAQFKELIKNIKSQYGEALRRTGDPVWTQKSSAKTVDGKV